MKLSRPLSHRKLSGVRQSLLRDPSFGGVLTGGISLAGGYPVDLVSGPTYSGVYGIGALTAAWKTGPLFDLVFNSVTTTIHAVDPGYPDVKAIAAALGTSPTSGFAGGTISKFYDQLGVKDWIPFAGMSVPELWLINGKVSLATSGGISSTVQGLVNTLGINNRSVSIFAAITPFATQPIGTLNSIGMVFGTGVPSASTATDMGLLASATDSDLGAKLTTICASLGDATHLEQTISPYIGIQSQILSGVAGAASTIVGQNGISASGEALTVGSSAAAILGDFSTHFPFCGRYQGLIISSSVFTAPQIAAMTTAFANWSGINLNVNRTNKVNVVIDGSSTDLGQGSDPVTGGYGVSGLGGYGYCEQLKDQLPSVSWHNFAVSGATMTQRTADYTSNLIQNSAFQSGSTNNILIAPGISAYAELLNQSGNAAATFAIFQTWLAAAKSVAWTRIYVLAYPDALTTGMAAYTALLLAGQAAGGYQVVDGRTVLIPLITANNPPYTNGDSHPMVLGSGLYVGLFKPLIQSFM